MSSATECPRHLYLPIRFGTPASAERAEASSPVAPSSAFVYTPWRRPQSGPAMHFWYTLSKDLRLFIDRPAYRAYVALLCLTMAFGTAAGIALRSDQDAEAVRWERANLESLGQVKEIYSFLGPGYTQRFPSAPLSAIAHGAEDLITSPFVTQDWTKQIIAYVNRRGPIANFIRHLDIANLLILLAPILVIYLCHGLVLEEIQNGTLKAKLMFGAGIHSCVAAKFMAALVGCLFPIAAIYGACIATLDGVTALVREEWLRAGLILVSMALPLIFWISLSFLVQAYVSSTRTAIAVLALAWSFSSFILPQGTFVLNQEKKLLTTAKYNAARSDLFREFMASYKAFDESPDRRRPTDYMEEFRFSSLFHLEILKRGISKSAYAELAQYFDTLTVHPSSALLSPFHLTEVIVTELANTGVGDYLNFRLNMLKYQGQFYRLFLNPRFLDWLNGGPRPEPVELLQWLKWDFRRLPLHETWARIRLPMITLFWGTLGSGILALLVLPRRVSRRV